MIQRVSFLVIFLLSLSACATTANSSHSMNYPAHWWKQFPDSARSGDWEILPHEAKVGEVILSKKNELGIFSNFGATPFSYDGEKYGSIEGFWQMMKYPDPKDINDPRNKFTNEYPYTRDEVKLLDGFIGKKAGDDANKINKKYGVKDVSYKGKHFNYKDRASGSAFHYQIIKGATQAKIYQNHDTRELLITTRGLVLRPDHTQGSSPPPSYEYFKILMGIRKNLK
jgi:predicted NAD-dependent protein-ADP-ribosyltransferase YbiA (DUF1768 family)